MKHNKTQTNVKKSDKNSNLRNSCLKMDMYEAGFKPNLDGENSEIDSEGRSLLGSCITIFHILALLAYAY